MADHSEPFDAACPCATCQGYTMAAKKGTATRSARTGSYTVRVPKSASTGKFVSESKAKGRIEVRAEAVEAAGLRRQVEGSFVVAMRRARAEAKAEALEEAADAYDNDITLYADIERRSLASEGRDADSIQDIGVAWLRARAAAIRTTPTETTSGQNND